MYRIYLAIDFITHNGHRFSPGTTVAFDELDLLDERTFVEVLGLKGLGSFNIAILNL